MADQDTTQDTNEDIDDDADDFDDENFDDNTPDPFEGLHRVAEELRPGEDPESGQEARIKAVANSLREKLTACQNALGTEGLPNPDDSARASRTFVDAMLFMLEELSETFMPYLASLASATCDNVMDIREWGEQEVEPLLDQFAGGAVDGESTGSQLMPNDGKAIDALLGELHFVLSNAAGSLNSESDEFKALQTRMGHIDQMRSHVQKITLTDDANLS